MKKQKQGTEAREVGSIVECLGDRPVCEIAAATSVMLSGCNRDNNSGILTLIYEMLNWITVLGSQPCCRNNAVIASAGWQLYGKHRWWQREENIFLSLIQSSGCSFQLIWHCAVFSFWLKGSARVWNLVTRSSKKKSISRLLDSKARGWPVTINYFTIFPFLTSDMPSLLLPSSVYYFVNTYIVGPYTEISPWRTQTCFPLCPHSATDPQQDTTETVFVFVPHKSAKGSHRENKGHGKHSKHLFHSGFISWDCTGGLSQNAHLLYTLYLFSYCYGLRMQSSFQSQRK